MCVSLSVGVSYRPSTPIGERIYTGKSATRRIGGIIRTMKLASCVYDVGFWVILLSVDFLGEGVLFAFGPLALMHVIYV